MSLEPQLKILVSKYYKQICQYLNGQRSFKDLIDGKCFEKRWGTVNLIIYTDGIPIMKNKTKFWPVFASLVELPPIIRESKNNKLIAGVWYGYNDPCSDVLFESLFNEFNKLNKKRNRNQIKDRKVKILVNIYG